VLLTALLCSVEVECDRRMERALCRGPSCGRCLQTCPGDTVGHWGRDWPACDEYRSPYGFAKLTGHIEAIVAAGTPAERKDLLRSEATFNLWQSILRGAGVVTGCRRCADVCPVGADYAAMLEDAVDAIPESTPEKAARLAAMSADEAAGRTGDGYAAQARWIGSLPYLGKKG
jgi:epoxyqueuosine reductase QueG